MIGRDDLYRGDEGLGHPRLIAHEGFVVYGVIRHTPLSRLLFIIADTLRLWATLAGYNDEDDTLHDLARLIDLHGIYFAKKGV